MANELVGLCWLIDFPSPTMRLVVMKLCDCAEPDGTNVFPSVATLARETGFSEAAVRKQLAALRECGLLTDIEDEHGSAFGRTTKVREIDTDKMRLVSGHRVRGRGVRPSSHVFAEIETGALGKKGEPVTEWRIVPRPIADQAPDPASDPSPSPGDDTPPPDGGVDGPDPSTTWRGDIPPPLHQEAEPLHDVSGTPPPGGPNPSRTTTFTLPPNPRGAGEQVEGLVSKGRVTTSDLVASLLADSRHAQVTARLIAPVLAKRRLRCPDGTDKLAELRSIRDAARDLAGPLLDRAAELLLADDGTTTTAARFREALDGVRKGGLMIPIKPGSLQYAAWLRHYDDRDPKVAALMRRFGAWQAPTEWPAPDAGGHPKAQAQGATP